MRLPNITQWQTARADLIGTGASVPTEDTLLSRYTPDELTDAVIRDKMIAVHPASVIALRAFGRNANNDTCTLTVSGWMTPNKPKGAGVGQRIWRGQLILGNKTWNTGSPPLDDGKWPLPSAGAYFEVDTWNAGVAGGVNFAGAYALDSALATGAADLESMLVLPTLGYTHLLLEVTDKDNSGTEMASIGFLWRPLEIGNSATNFFRTL